MKVLMKSDLRKTDVVRPLKIIGEPLIMPVVPEGFEVVCYLDLIWLVTCETLEDMQMLYKQYRVGLGIDISWCSVKYITWFFDNRQIIEQEKSIYC
jgi:hypothetical protein